MEEIEISDAARARALSAALMEAEKACAIESGPDDSIEKRAEQIVRAARKFALEPRLYKLAWLIGKWATPVSH